MEHRISLRGRTARRIVKMANHLPIIGVKMQSGELRAKLNQREKPWKCPEHLSWSVIEMEHFTMELLQSNKEKKGIILQLHGGGYYGTLYNAYRNMAALYNEVSDGLDVLTIDYRVAPDHPYPAALEDAIVAYQWIQQQGYCTKSVFVAGDSAGGGLALALTLYLRDHAVLLPKGIITMSAWADLTKSGVSYKENYDADPLFGGTMDSLVYKDGYYKGSNPEEPYISPVFGEYHDFPALLMQVGEHEMLLSDTLTVAARAKEAGVKVKEHVYSGMFHVFQMGLMLYPESRQAWMEIGKFVRRLMMDEERTY